MEEVCLTIVIFCASVLVIKKDNGTLKLKDYKIFSKTIGYSVIFAVLVEIITAVTLAIQDLIKWKKEKNKKKKGLDPQSVVEEKHLFASNDEEKTKFKLGGNAKGYKSEARLTIKNVPKTPMLNSNLLKKSGKEKRRSTKQGSKIKARVTVNKRRKSRSNTNRLKLLDADAEASSRFYDKEKTEELERMKKQMAEIDIATNSPVSKKRMR